MKYRNDSDKPVGPFVLRGKSYEVAAGAEVDIPDDLAYAVQRRKLPLTCLEAPKPPKEEPRAESGLPDAARERIQQERRRAEAAEAQVKRLNDALSELKVQQRKALDEQGKTEADLRGRVTSLQEEVKNLEQQLLAVTKDRDDLLETATGGEKKGPGKAGGGQKPS